MKDFLTKNFKYVIIFLIALAAVIYFVLKEKQVARISANLTKLQLSYELLRQDRDVLKRQGDSLQAENKKIQQQKDSINKVQQYEKLQLAFLIQKHKKQIDSLLNVPNDTIYVRLQPIYPRPAQEPLQYPFSGTQIRGIYSTALSYPRLQNEYGLQTTQLNTCNDLNKKFQESENNYKAQIVNLNKSIVDCDKQVGVKDQELKLTQKQLKARTFWSWVEKGAIIAVGAYAIIK